MYYLYYIDYLYAYSSYIAVSQQAAFTTVIIYKLDSLIIDLAIKLISSDVGAIYTHIHIQGQGSKTLLDLHHIACVPTLCSVQ